MSSKITTEKYHVVRLEKIKHYLESLAERENAKYYEIYVDNMKVVDKTNDPNQFDEYKMYVDENTQMLKILLYTGSENSPRNDKFIFSFENKEDKNTLGEVEVQSKIAAAINSERERIKIEQLEDKVSVLEDELSDANEYIEKLETNFENLRNQKIDDSKQMKYGLIASVAIEQILKRNPKVLGSIPLLGSLSGLLEDSQSQPNEKVEKTTTSEINYSFKEVNKFETEVGKILTEHFSENQMEVVLQILYRFAEDPSTLPTIYDLLFTKSDN
jgi:hypothetical protein